MAIRSTRFSHPIDHNNGDFEDTSAFHNGIDLPSVVGDTVKAVITGVLRRVIHNDDSTAIYTGLVEICFSLQDSNNFWLYGHIYDIDTTYRGFLDDSINYTTVPTTDFYIGRICDWPDGGGVTDHLYLGKICDKINIMHPLDTISPPPL